MRPRLLSRSDAHPKAVYLKRGPLILIIFLLPSTFAACISYATMAHATLLFATGLCERRAGFVATVQQLLAEAEGGGGCVPAGISIKLLLEPELPGENGSLDAQGIFTPDSCRPSNLATQLSQRNGSRLLFVSQEARWAMLK